MPRPILAAAAAILLAAVACSAPADPTISDSAYDRSCRVDSDCVLVTSGDVCTCCAGGGAINVSDFARYQADLRNLEASCASGCTDSCISGPPVACIDATCTVCPLEGCPGRTNVASDAGHD